MRPCEIFLEKQGVFLAGTGYEPDPGQVEFTSEGIAFYHYSRENRVEEVLGESSGLWARMRYAHGYMVEGFLEPLPNWLVNCPYFGNLGIEMVKMYIGDLLLRIEVPRSFRGLYVADYAHQLECKQLDHKHRSGGGLSLEYDCSSGREVTKAYVNSFVPVNQYRGGHVAPVMQAVSDVGGIAIPRKYITIPEIQPLKK